MDILFDLDDTLLDKHKSLASYADYLCSRHSTYLDNCKEKFTTAFIHENEIIQPKAKVFEKLQKEFLLPSDLSNKMLNEFDNEFHNFAQSFDGVLSAIQFLKNMGVKIGCVTNGRDFFQRNKIKALGLIPYLDVIVTSGEFGVKKPDPRIFQHTMGLLGIKPHNTCFCGDSLKADIAPAKELGLITIWKSEEESDLADYRFSNYLNFPDIWDKIYSQN